MFSQFKSSLFSKSNKNDILFFSFRSVLFIIVSLIQIISSFNSDHIICCLHSGEKSALKMHPNIPVREINAKIYSFPAKIMIK